MFVAAAAGSAALAVDQPPRPVCEIADVALVDTVDSARAMAGDAFRFKTVADLPATAFAPAVPKDTIGYGLVMGAHHAGRGGKPGHLLVDTRFFALSDGTHVSATFLPRARYDAEVLDGSPANAPGFLGFIPFASVMTGTYNTVHYGKEFVFKPGTAFHVVVGDGLALGQCVLPTETKPGHAASGSPAPTAASSAEVTPPATAPSIAPAATPSPLPTVHL